ncbi:MAG: cyclic nucleotide-binding domain-containing protein [Anaerolineales bacterium]|nr:cyclic nucleotide-binding domain-containing protein [Anaerolineales bacterium]
MMTTIETTHAQQLLKQAFPAIGDEDSRSLSAMTSTGRYRPGQEIVREGEHGTTLYVLAEGDADIIVHTEDGQEILVDTIGAVGYFGEMSFFGESTRMATIRARTACRTLELEQASFMAVARANPELLQTLLAQIIGHLRRNDRAVIRELNVKSAVLQEAYADLAEQEELRSQFIATLSHELRTPLTSIQGFLGLISQGAITGESLKVALRSVTRNVEKLVALTNNMLILYEMYPGAPHYDYHNPTDIVVEALNAAQASAEGGTAQVRLDIASSLPEIYVDKQGVVLAVRALIENAIKYTPSKAPVEIRLYCPDETHVAIEVVDQGIGIPVEAFDRIFDPFFRLEQPGSQQLFPGVGIGLTIAKLMVGRHDGQIEVRSTLDEGSTFTILLPLR